MSLMSTAAAQNFWWWVVESVEEFHCCLGKGGAWDIGRDRGTVKGGCICGRFVEVVVEVMSIVSMVVASIMVGILDGVLE